MTTEEIEQLKAKAQIVSEKQEEIKYLKELSESIVKSICFGRDIFIYRRRDSNDKILNSDSTSNRISNITSHARMQIAYAIEELEKELSNL
jgi:hypothetical protein